MTLRSFVIVLFSLLAGAAISVVLPLMFAATTTSWHLIGAPQQSEWRTDPTTNIRWRRWCFRGGEITELNRALVIATYSNVASAVNSQEIEIHDLPAADFNFSRFENDGFEGCSRWTRMRRICFGWPTQNLSFYWYTGCNRFAVKQGWSYNRITTENVYNSQASVVILPLEISPLNTILNTLFYSLLVFLALLLTRKSVRLIRRLRGRCSRCGYILGNLVPVRCPECGWRPYGSNI